MITMGWITFFIIVSFIAGIITGIHFYDYLTKDIDDEEERK